MRREMRRRAAVEPVIGHVKAEHRMDRNYLRGREGDRANAVLAAAGYNFGLLLRWFEALWRALIQMLLRTAAAPQSALKSRPRGFFTDNYLEDTPWRRGQTEDPHKNPSSILPAAVIWAPAAPSGALSFPCV